MSVATSTAIALGTAAAGATAGIYGANKSAGAAKEAATDQTSAANYAADAQAKSNAAALDFQKQQAAADQAKYEASQRANYAQYLTHYNAVKGLGGQLGVDLPDAPSYDAALGSNGAPGATAPAATAPGTSAPGPAAPGLTPPAGGPVLAGATTSQSYTGAPTDRAAIKAWVSGLASLPGADPSLSKDPDYWVGRIVDTGGLTGANSDYWTKAATGPTAFFANPGREGGMAGAVSGVLPSAINSYLSSGGTLQAPALQRPAPFRLGGAS
jgi:hypothetical protein